MFSVSLLVCAIAASSLNGVLGKPAVRPHFPDVYNATFIVSGTTLPFANGTHVNLAVFYNASIVTLGDGTIQGNDGQSSSWSVPPTGTCTLDCYNGQCCSGSPRTASVSGAMHAVRSSSAAKRAAPVRPVVAPGSATFCPPGPSASCSCGSATTNMFFNNMLAANATMAGSCDAGAGTHWTLVENVSGDTMTWDWCTTNGGNGFPTSMHLTSTGGGGPGWISFQAVSVDETSCPPSEAFNIPSGCACIV